MKENAICPSNSITALTAMVKPLMQNQVLSVMHALRSFIFHSVCHVTKFGIESITELWKITPETDIAQC